MSHRTDEPGPANPSEPRPRCRHACAIRMSPTGPTERRSVRRRERLGQGPSSNPVQGYPRTWGVPPDHARSSTRNPLRRLLVLVSPPSRERLPLVGDRVDGVGCRYRRHAGSPPPLRQEPPLATRGTTVTRSPLSAGLPGRRHEHQEQLSSVPGRGSRDETRAGSGAGRFRDEEPRDLPAPAPSSSTAPRGSTGIAWNRASTRS